MQLHMFSNSDLEILLKIILYAMDFFLNVQHGGDAVKSSL